MWAKGKMRKTVIESEVGGKKAHEKRMRMVFTMTGPAISSEHPWQASPYIVQ